MKSSNQTKWSCYVFFVLIFLLRFPLSIIAQQNEQPNILWILTDDHRYDAVRSFNKMLHGREMSELGYVESPNIDRLAQMGTTFVNSYCQAQGCAPSRASMHYGRYPFRSGVYEFEYHNNNAEHCRPTIPEQMVSLGYQTIHIGKLGFRIRTLKDGKCIKPNLYQKSIEGYAEAGYVEWTKKVITEVDGKKLAKPIRSSDHFMTPDGKYHYMSYSLEEQLPEYKGMTDKTVEKFDILRHYNAKKGKSNDDGGILAGVSPQPAGKTRDGYIASFFIDYLNNTKPKYRIGEHTIDGIDPSKPQFFHIGFNFPHTPVLPPASFRERFHKHTYNIPQLGDNELETMPKQMRKAVKDGGSDNFTDEEKQKMIRDYYAFCAYGDDLIGQSVDAFIEHNKKINKPWMIVYVNGDHGWKLNNHGSVSKFTPWNEDSQNPIIVVSSDKKAYPAGKVVTDYTELVDIAPTILAAGGADLKEDKFSYLDGFELADVQAKKAPVRDYVVGESHAVTGPRAYIRTKDYMFTIQTRPDKKRGVNMEWARNATYEELDPGLYHFAKDPNELNNLAFHKDYQKVAMAMKEKLINIVLGDNRVEVDWGKGTKVFGTEVHRSNFAPGAHDYKLKIK